jgi:hypothetical protein
MDKYLTTFLLMTFCGSIISIASFYLGRTIKYHEDELRNIQKNIDKHENEINELETNFKNHLKVDHGYTSNPN